MATATRSAPKRKPNTRLQCRRCHGHHIRVSSAQQMLRRTFRRDGEQKAHLHAHVRCERCGREWWSAHTTALEVSKRLDAEQKDSEVVNTGHHSGAN